MKHLNKKTLFIIIGIIMIGVFAIPSFLNKDTKNESNNEQKFLSEHELNDLSVEEMVSKLDERTDEARGFNAGITSESLTLITSEEEYTYNIPSDKFYLSFAPFINNTHPCGNHNLVTCRGELQNVPISVIIKDASNQEIVNKEFTTMENGFIGIWLPKNIDATITVEYNGLSATGQISTYENDGTCLTTLKLS